MSKAFTKEDDDGGFVAPTATKHVGGSRFVSRLGVRLAKEALARKTLKDKSSLLDRAHLESIAEGTISEPASEDLVALGAHVRFRDERGRERSVVLVSADEIGLVPDGMSVTAPIAAALIGARAGEVREFERDDSEEELTVIAVDYPH